MTRNGIVLGTAALAAAGFTAFAGAQVVPDGFEVEVLATGLLQPKGLDAPHYRAGAGPMGDYLYIAESGADQIIQLDRETGDMALLAPVPLFPVGMGCYGGPFAQYLYIGCATGGGIVRLDVDGNETLFALDTFDIAGLDFGKGRFGQFLYAGEWTAGRIWRVDPEGNAMMFAEIPGVQTRYLEFSQGGAFGNYLYFTDFLLGDIYRVDHTGQEALFASVGSPCLEGFAFGPGGVFGHDLYVGDLCEGEIYKVRPDGTFEVWASGFTGVADIIFQPGGAGGFTMFLVDGNDAVYKIYRTGNLGQGQAGAGTS